MLLELHVSIPPFFALFFSFIHSSCHEKGHNMKIIPGELISIWYTYDIHICIQVGQGHWNTKQQRLGFNSQSLAFLLSGSATLIRFLDNIWRLRRGYNLHCGTFRYWFVWINIRCVCDGLMSGMHCAALLYESSARVCSNPQSKERLILMRHRRIGKWFIWIGNIISSKDTFDFREWEQLLSKQNTS